MLSIHKPFPALKTTSLGAAVFVVGLGGSLALLTYLYPHNPDSGGHSTASVVSNPPSTNTTKKTDTKTASTTTSGGDATPPADPPSTSQPVIISPTSQQPTSYGGSSSGSVIPSLVNPTPVPVSTTPSAPTIISQPGSTTGTGTSGSTSDPSPTKTPDPSLTGTVSGVVQGATDTLPDPGLNLPLK